jgi:hypothetical protein
MEVTMDNLILLSTYAIEHAWVEGKPLKENLLAVMHEALTGNGMYVIDEERRCKTALAVALTHAKGEDKEWLEGQVKNLQRLTAFINATEAGLEPSVGALADGAVRNERDYTISELWAEAKKAKEAKEEA